MVHQGSESGWSTFIFFPVWGMEPDVTRLNFGLPIGSTGEFKMWCATKSSWSILLKAGPNVLLLVIWTK